MAGARLYLLLVVLGATGYTPVLRRQIRTLEESGPESPEFKRLLKRGQVVGGILGILVIVIVFLMVTKPTP